MKKILFSLFIMASMLSFSSCSKDDDEDTIAEIEVSESSIQTLKGSVSFSEVDNAYYYDISFAEGDEDYEYVVSVSDFTYSFTNLKAGTDYKVKVEAISSTGDVIGEGELSFTTLESVSELVGTWTYTYSDYTKSYTFDSDGTGSYINGDSEYIIKWFAETPVVGETATLTIYLYGSDYDSGYSITTYDYTYYGEGEAMSIGSNTYIPE